MLTLPMRFLPALHMYTIVIIIIIVASSWHHHHRQPSSSPASLIIVASHHRIASSHRIGIAASPHPCRDAKRQLNISSRVSVRMVSVRISVRAASVSVSVSQRQRQGQGQCQRQRQSIMRRVSSDLPASRCCLRVTSPGRHCSRDPAK